MPYQSSTLVPAEYPNRQRVPALYHVAAAAYVAFCLWLATQRPESYREAMQEDRLVEWLSVFAYAAAGTMTLVRAVRARRPFDGLVGVFLLFVAGEEMSWGQRLFGLTPPSYFLEHNTQQEMNVHNFSHVFGGPKGPFTLILLGYAVVMPLVALVAPGRRFLSRIGASPPPVAAIPWFLAAIVLFVWYPVSFTGEWNELLAGSAFLVAAGATGPMLAALAPAGLVFGLALTQWSAMGRPDPARLRCAAAELESLVGAARAEVLGSSSAHKRVWTLVREERLETDSVTARLGAAVCERESAARRRFAVDPWGTAYWMRITRESDHLRITVYSFGPNRRRDLDRTTGRAGDDLYVSRSLPLQ